MKTKRLSHGLQVILIGVFLGIIGIYGFLVPGFGKRLVQIYPEYASQYFPWLLLIGLTAVPCMGILVFGWKIARSIGLGCAFCNQNSFRCRAVAYLCLGNTSFFFLGNLVFLFLNWGHPAVLLASGCLLLIGIAMAVVFLALGQLVEEAAKIQEENRMTI